MELENSSIIFSAPLSAPADAIVPFRMTESDNQHANIRLVSLASQRPLVAAGQRHYDDKQVDVSDLVCNCAVCRGRKISKMVLDWTQQR
jgi:hypothetical protein